MMMKHMINLIDKARILTNSNNNILEGAIKITEVMITEEIITITITITETIIKIHSKIQIGDKKVTNLKLLLVELNLQMLQ